MIRLIALFGVTRSLFSLVWCALSLPDPLRNRPVIRHTPMTAHLLSLTQRKYDWIHRGVEYSYASQGRLARLTQ